jgi:DNA repair exonuclease SbcCD ATPase subunit
MRILAKVKDPARFIISVIFVSPLLALSVATFHDTAAAVTATETSAQNLVTAREERIRQRAQKYRGQFTWNQLQRTKQRCEAAQQKLQTVSSRIETLKTARSQSYTKVTERLDSAVTTLKSLSLDTTELSAQISELKVKTSMYQESLLLYTAALGDLAQPNCANEAENFRAALQELRELRKTLADQGQDVREYLKNTIKPTLGAALSQIKTHQDTTSNE